MWPLKYDGWKTILSCWCPAPFQGQTCLLAWRTVYAWNRCANTPSKYTSVATSRRYPQYLARGFRNKNTSLFTVAVTGKGRWLILFCGFNFFKTRKSRWLSSKELRNLHPGRLTWNLRVFSPGKGKSSSNSQFLNLPGWPSVPYGWITHHALDLGATSATWTWHEERPGNESGVLSQHPVGQHPIMHRYCHLVTWFLQGKATGDYNHLQIWTL